VEIGPIRKNLTFGEPQSSCQGTENKIFSFHLKGRFRLSYQMSAPQQLLTCLQNAVDRFVYVSCFLNAMIVSFQMVTFLRLNSCYFLSLNLFVFYGSLFFSVCGRSCVKCHQTKTSSFSLVFRIDFGACLPASCLVYLFLFNNT